LEGHIAEPPGDVVGALAGQAGFFRASGDQEGDQEMVARGDGHPGEPSLVVERPGQPFGFAKVAEASLGLSQLEQHSPKLDPKVDGLLQRLAGLGQIRQGHQGLLEEDRRLAVGGPGERLGAGLSKVRHGLVPHLAPERVVGQPLDVLAQSVGMEALDRLHDPGVEGAPPILQETAVGHVVGQGVLEGVLEVGEGARGPPRDPGRRGAPSSP
jgi:hypothetical protein